MSKQLLHTLPGLVVLMFGLAVANESRAAAPSMQVAAQHGALLAQCKAVLPEAEPLRAQLVRQAMFRLELSMSYRRAPGGLSALELQSAARSEHIAYDLLLDACRPLLL